MFLFNSLGQTGDVNSALKNASRRTGVDLDYLRNTAKRESNLDPKAKAGSSSASGLFQFLERTWLSVLKETGSRHGYGELAKEIQPAAGGGYTVRDAAARKQILDLRQDPKAAALMAGEFTARNAESLRTALGRPASEGELYAAHFLGPRGAVELVRLADTAPSSPAAERFPAAAAANRSIFYKAGGVPRSAQEVYARLTAGYDATPAVPENASYLAFAPGRSSEDYVFHGLFRSGGSGLGPMGRAVSSFWSGFPASKANYGATENPGDVEIETQQGRDVTMRVRPDAPEAAAETPAGEKTGLRRYGLWRDDPSLPVR